MGETACVSGNHQKRPGAAIPLSSPRRRPLLLVGSLLALAVVTSAAGAEEPGDPNGRGLFHRGSMQVGLLAGYGVGLRFESNENRSLEDVRPVEIIPRFGWGLTDPLGGEAWYRGNVEMLLEGALVFNTEPKSGSAFGAGATLRYNFLPWRNVVPFIDANAGMVGLDFDLPGQSDGFNFNVGAGVGSHWLVGERTSIATEVRWQHFSNAGTSHPNNGINDVLFLVGVTRFFR